MGHLKTSNCTASTSIATTAWMEEEKEVHHDGRPRQQTIVQIFIDFAVANTLQCTVPPIAEYLQATDQTNDDTIEMLRGVRGPTNRTYRLQNTRNYDNIRAANLSHRKTFWASRNNEIYRSCVATGNRRQLTRVYAELAHIARRRTRRRSIFIHSARFLIL